MLNFFKKAFRDMANSAKLQREADKAAFAAAKAEARANFAEAKAAGSPKKAKNDFCEKCKEMTTVANDRRIMAEQRIANANENI